MRFSVVIPLYNKKAYIKRCLRSVLRQTHTDFEVLVINDGSTDGSEQELDHFPDERVRLIRQTNQGVSVARNKGVDLASNDVVFFLDADDTWEPTFLEEMARLVAVCPDAGVYAGGTRKIFADGRALHNVLAASAFVGDTAILKDYFQIFADIGQSPFSNSSFGVRRDRFHRAGGYAPGVKLTEDSDLWVRLALISKIAFNPESLANYFVETDDNTRMQAQTSDFQVITTLRRALDGGEVPQNLQNSAERLLALQKQAQIKRLILLGKSRSTWNRLVDRDIWTRRPLTTLLLVLAASMPHGLFLRIRNVKLLRR
jgi:glycosyltransferase involved in cell wall biosynthesis